MFRQPNAEFSDERNAAVWESETIVGWTVGMGLTAVERHLFHKYYRPGQRVLDLACGTGRTTSVLSSMGLSITGVDRSVRLLEQARKSFPGISFEVGNYCDWSDPDESYDHVLISFNGLDYACPEERRALAIRNCCRMLRTGGTFIFSSHNIKSFHISPYYTSGRNFQLQASNVFTAFRRRAYILEPKMGTYTFFASPTHVVSEVTREGFEAVEIVGRTPQSGRLATLLFAHHIHYVCRKLPK